MARTEYDAMLKADLQAEAEARGLPTSGTKDDLVARLLEDDTTEEAEVEAYVEAGAVTTGNISLSLGDAVHDSKQAVDAIAADLEPDDPMAEAQIVIDLDARALSGDEVDTIVRACINRLNTGATRVRAAALITAEGKFPVTY